jgi:hypothetical protein
MVGVMWRHPPPHPLGSLGLTRLFGTSVYRSKALGAGRELQDRLHRQEPAQLRVVDRPVQLEMGAITGSLLAVHAMGEAAWPLPGRAPRRHRGHGTSAQGAKLLVHAVGHRRQEHR